MSDTILYNCNIKSIMENMKLQDIMKLRIENKYDIQYQLGEGSFGKIFNGINKITNEEVAIKLEDINNEHNVSILKHEAKIYKLLENVNGIPKLRSFGKKENYNYLIIDKLGYSLEELRIKCGGKFSLKTVLMISFQLLTRIESIHKKGIIHRDIKPDNFLIGSYNTLLFSKIHIIDFGLSTLYLNENDEHIENKKKKDITGTLRYISVNVHNKNSPSRRDDLESIGYVLVYLLIGKLPWQSINKKNREDKIKIICDYKSNIHLCHLFPNIPYEFILYINYCRHLHYDEEPDYKYLKGIFMNLFKHHGFDCDFNYDWVIKKIIPY